MAFNKQKPQSIWWFMLLVAVVTCVSLLIAQRMWLADSSARENSPETPSLTSLMIDGEDLHDSLRTQEIDTIRDIPKNAELPQNPYLSSDDEFVEAIARGGSQGRLDSEGIRTAFYARYKTEDNEVGIYGLEAKTKADAAQREKAAREIWAHNASFNRAHVLRKDLILVVIWHDGVSPECWEAVKAGVKEKLNAIDDS